jgi:hypothetical protein
MPKLSQTTNNKFRARLLQESSNDGHAETAILFNVEILGLENPT